MHHSREEDHRLCSDQLRKERNITGAEVDAVLPEEFDSGNEKRLALAIFLGRRRNLEPE
jgi:hypothetical protein